MTTDAREGPAVDQARALTEAGAALRERPLSGVLEAVSEACRRWREPGPDRETGETSLAEHYGVPRAAIAEILDTAFETWTAESLLDWVAAELGDPGALDRFVDLAGARRRAFGPRLAVFLGARGVPTTPVADIVSALCVKAPVWLKPATGADDLAARFARTLSEVDAGIGEAVTVEGWLRGSPQEEAALGSADLVAVTGGEAAIAAVRRMVRPDAQLVLHGPRLSAAIVLEEALVSKRDETTEALARDTAFAGQMGCLSPVLVYLEAGRREVTALLDPVHRACAARWPSMSRTEAGVGERAAFAEWRATAQLEKARGAAGPWRGDLESAWTVHLRFEGLPPDPPPVPRFLTLIPLTDIERAAELFARRRGTIASVGVAGPAKRVAGVAEALGAAGVERVARLGSMQAPPAAWRRDGRTTLGDLVRWVDLDA